MPLQRTCLGRRYGYVPQWAPAASMALFVPAYMPMQYAGQQLPDTSNGQGSQVGFNQTCSVFDLVTRLTYFSLLSIGSTLLPWCDRKICHRCQ